MRSDKENYKRRPELQLKCSIALYIRQWLCMPQMIIVVHHAYLLYAETSLLETDK